MRFLLVGVLPNFLRYELSPFSLEGHNKKHDPVTEPAAALQALSRIQPTRRVVIADPSLGLKAR